MEEQKEEIQKEADALPEVRRNEKGQRLRKDGTIDGRHFFKSKKGRRYRLLPKPELSLDKIQDPLKYTELTFKVQIKRVGGLKYDTDGKIRTENYIPIIRLPKAYLDIVGGWYLLNLIPIAAPEKPDSITQEDKSKFSNKFQKDNTLVLNQNVGVRDA